MGDSQDEFLRSLQAIFAVEAREHVQAMIAGLLELEASSDHAAKIAVIGTMFREAHSLKGAARAVENTGIESLCQSLEEALAAWQRRKGAVTQATLDEAHGIVNAIDAALGGANPPGAPAAEPAHPAPIGADRAPAAADTVRLKVDKLDAHLLEAEGMVAVTQTTRHQAETLRSLTAGFSIWRKEWGAVERDARELRRMHDRAATGGERRSSPSLGPLLGFVDWQVDHMDTFERQLDTLSRSVDRDQEVIGQLVANLLEESKNLLLLPFGSLATPLRKMVHDLCRDQAKEADLVVGGGDVEVDKRILEEIKPSLIHLLRNAIDHGIESPEERQRAGKPRRATIHLEASHASGRDVAIVLSDDGRGVDSARLKASAVERGILTADAAGRLAETEVLQLMFEAEVSTSPMITRLSGRGLGLAIVREGAAKLGGTVAVASTLGAGTRFTIALPATLATFRGVVVEAARQWFVLPTIQLDRVARFAASSLRTVEGCATIALSGRTVPVVELTDILGVPRDAASDEATQHIVALIIGDGDQRIALIVDAVHSEEEVLVKPLRPPLSRVRHVSGATVLGSGRVVPILNVGDLLRSAKRAAKTTTRGTASARPEPDEVLSVLVAEDSITSRMLIKGILESAGYRVKTAVDGIEALSLLRTESFDVVVSDVEMPRLNGFDLTTTIRSDKKVAHLPVVLVTALETREDRERGIDAGANAYIVKSKFDQGDLLEVIRRLVKRRAAP